MKSPHKKMMSRFNSSWMTWSGIALSILIVCLQGGASAGPAAQSDVVSVPRPLEIGKPAPVLAVNDAFGERRDLTALKGKKGLLLTFFPKCFTFNCTNQISALRDHYPELEKGGIEVWGVSTDAAEGPRGQRAFSEHLKLPFPLLPDVDRSISLKFGAVQSREQMAARMTILSISRGTCAGSTSKSTRAPMEPMSWRV